MEDSSASQPVETFDSTLRKYARIWVWSILSSAAVAQVTMGTMGAFVRVNGRGSSAGVVNLFFALLSFMSPAAALVSVYYLLRFLRGHVLPVLFPLSGAHDDADGARLLYLAFANVVLGLAVQVSVRLLTIVFDAAA
jgi:hypothetical protein